MIDLGHWVTDLVIPDILPYGFIYIITNKINNRKYIGKKQMRSIKKLAPLKGKKNKRHFDTETEWKTYTSSSNELLTDLLKNGKENFEFKIVKWCDSKWDLSFSEARMQFDHQVLLKDDYYNGIINCRIGKVPRSLQNNLIIDNVKN